MSDTYEDIIHINYQSKYRTPMPIQKRAAQFLPFAALNGYEQAIQETDRAIETKNILSIDEQEILNRKLNLLTSNLPILANITYFIKYKNNNNYGRYVNKDHLIKKIDSMQTKLIVDDNLCIYIKDIIDCSCSFFEDFNDY